MTTEPPNNDDKNINAGYLIALAVLAVIVGGAWWFLSGLCSSFANLGHA